LQWLRGDHLPPEEVTPFECMAQLLSRSFETFLGGFTGRRNFLYVGKDPGLVPPNMLTIPSIVASTWDAVNDPFVGSFMDAHPWKTDTHRWIMRANAVLKGLVSVVQLLFPGLSPMARVIFWTATGMLSESLDTFGTVSRSKIMAAVTPFTEQRRKLQNWNNMGWFLGLALTTVPHALIGLRTALNITTYQIVVIGALLALPITVGGNLLPSFVRQRVEFPRSAPQEDPYRGEKFFARAAHSAADILRGLARSFAIVRHNGWFIRNTIAKFITIFTPAIDNMYFYRFLVRPVKVGNLQLEGELLMIFKSVFVGAPGSILMPMASRYIKKVGGEKNMVLLDASTKVVTNLLRYFVCT